MLFHNDMKYNCRATINLGKGILRYKKSYYDIRVDLFHRRSHMMYACSTLQIIHQNGNQNIMICYIVKSFFWNLSIYYDNTFLHFSFYSSSEKAGIKWDILFYRNIGALVVTTKKELASSFNNDQQSNV